MEVDNAQVQFLADIKAKVRQAQYEALKAVNVQLINLYWELGRAISEKQTLGWGKAIVPTLAKELQREFPEMTGFSATNLWYMVQFYTEYQADINLQPLVGEISWSKHLVILSKCKDAQERLFYTLATKKTCKSKDRTVVEYALKTATLPIGVATYATTRQLPEAYQSLLPVTEEITRKLLAFGQ